LCRRVIIIDHGKIFFDGQLDEVLDRFADFKLVTIHCANTRGKAPAPAAAGTAPPDKPETGVPVGTDLSRFGEVVEQTSELVKLKVKRDRVIPVCKELLDELAVQDIDIQEVPIEDVIRQIFAR